MDNGYYDAIMCLEAIVGKDHNLNPKLPKNVHVSDVWRLLGEVQIENGNVNLGVAALEQCLLFNENDTSAMIQLAMAFANQGNTMNTVLISHLYLKRNSNYQTLFKESYSSYSEEDITAYDLIDLCSNVIRAEKELANVETHTILGLLYFVTDDFAKGAEQFKTCVHLNPEKHSLWNQLGKCLSNSRLSKLAVEAYSKALELKPNFIPALINMAMEYSNEKNYENSCQYYMKVLLQNANANVWSDFAASLKATNRNEIADSILSKPEKRDIKKIWLQCARK